MHMPAVSFGRLGPQSRPPGGHAPTLPPAMRPRPRRPATPLPTCPLPWSSAAPTSRQGCSQGAQIAGEPRPLAGLPSSSQSARAGEGEGAPQHRVHVPARARQGPAAGCGARREAGAPAGGGAEKASRHGMQGRQACRRRTGRAMATVRPTSVEMPCQTRERRKMSEPSMAPMAVPAAHSCKAGGPGKAGGACRPTPQTGVRHTRDGRVRSCTASRQALAPRRQSMPALEVSGRAQEGVEVGG